MALLHPSSACSHQVWLVVGSEVGGLVAPYCYEVAMRSSTKFSTSFFLSDSLPFSFSFVYVIQAHQWRSRKGSSWSSFSSLRGPLTRTTNTIVICFKINLFGSDMSMVHQEMHHCLDRILIIKICIINKK